MVEPMRTPADRAASPPAMAVVATEAISQQTLSSKYRAKHAGRLSRRGSTVFPEDLVTLDHLFLDLRLSRTTAANCFAEGSLPFSSAGSVA